MTIDIIRADFDRLSMFDRGDWDHNSHYHSFLLTQLPPFCENSLEIGCGTGLFTRLLAERSQHVVALDLSTQMIRIAKERSNQFTNIEYLEANVLEWAFPAEEFDCIVSIATFHHLPLDTILSRIRSSLKPGGILLVLDLWKADSVTGLLISMVAIPVQIFLNLVHTRRLRRSLEVRQAWVTHSQHDKFLSISDIKRQCGNLLPNAVIRRHLLWRYSLVWKKS